MLKKHLSGINNNFHEKHEKYQVLIIDDCQKDRNLLKATMNSELPENLISQLEIIESEDGETGLETLLTLDNCILILLDINMPLIDGYDVITKIRTDKQLSSKFSKIPIFCITNENELFVMNSLEKSNLLLGSDNVIKKPFNSQTNKIIKTQLYNHFQKLETARLDDTIYKQTIKNINSINTEHASNHTFSHNARVKEIVKIIIESKRLGLTELEKTYALRGVSVHDLGKPLGIPQYILDKKGPLTKEEADIMLYHVIISSILGNTDIKNKFSIESISELLHHEKYSGGGKPSGKALKQNNTIYIEHNGKIEPVRLNKIIQAIITADVFDAVTAIRPYSKFKRKIKDYSSELIEGLYTQFSIDLAEAYFECLPEIYKKYSANNIDMETINSLSNHYLDAIDKLKNSNLGEIINNYIDLDINPADENNLERKNKIREYVIDKIILPYYKELSSPYLEKELSPTLFKNIFKEEFFNYAEKHREEYSFFTLAHYYIEQGKAFGAVNMEDLVDFTEPLLEEVPKIYEITDHLKKITEIQEALLSLIFLNSSYYAHSSDISKDENITFYEEKNIEIQSNIDKLRTELINIKKHNDNHIKTTLKKFSDTLKTLINTNLKKTNYTEYISSLDLLIKEEEIFFYKLTKEETKP